MLPMRRDGFTYRLATNEDAGQIIHLIDSVYREIGDRISLEAPSAADADLLDIQCRYVDRGGEFSVLVSPSGCVVGSHAVLPVDAALGSFRRLYLIPELRGSEWGNILMNWALAQARLMTLQRVELWSDVRFARAHRYFARFGFQHDGQVRELPEGNMPCLEKRFLLDLEHARFMPPFFPVCRG